MEVPLTLLHHPIDVQLSVTVENYRNASDLILSRGTPNVNIVFLRV
jgi:hypothetical protein